MSQNDNMIFVRPCVQRMEPFSAAGINKKLEVDGVRAQPDLLAANENPMGPSPMALRAIREVLADLHRYPSASGAQVRSALGRKLGIAEDRIVLGNGSDDLIQLIGLATLEPGVEVVCGKPSFIRYPATALLAECDLVEVPLDAKRRLDLDAIGDALTPRTRIVWLANPNNPTGTVIGRDALDRLMERMPEGAAVVLDEAYYDFARHFPNLPNSVDYVRAGKPVIGLRTLSKSHGLAGLRIGFAVCPPEVAEAIHRIRQPFHVNALAQVATLAALSDTEHLERTLANNREGIAILSEAASSAGATPIPSYANFVWIELGRPAAAVVEALSLEGVTVRSGETFGCPQAIRVSVGTREQNLRFAKVFGLVMSREAKE
jgi:histidinol-phosphate aminotransferase